MLETPVATTGAVPTPDRNGTRAVTRHAEGEMNVRAMLAVLRRRKLPLAACMVLVPLCAWVALRQATPRFTATGALIYEQNEYKPRELQSILRVDPATEAHLATQAEILQSQHIAQKVVDRGNLYGNPEFNRTLRQAGWADQVLAGLLAGAGLAVPTADSAFVLGPSISGPAGGLSGLRSVSEGNGTIEAVQASLRARPVRFSHVIEVSFTAEDRLVAAAAVNHAMDAYIKEQYAARGKLARTGTQHFERRIRELTNEVERGEAEIAAYRATHGLSQGMHAAKDAEQISHLTEDLVRARGELAGALARLDAARGRAGASAQAAIAPSVAQLRVSRDQLAAQLQAQTGRLGPGHPFAEGLHRQLAEAQRSVDAETARVVAARDAEHRVAEERVSALERDLRTAQADADRIARAQVPLNKMLRDVDAWRTQLQSLLERQQQTVHQIAIEPVEAREISLALPPEHPSWPRSGPIMAAASASGVFLGLIMVYVLHLTDTTLHSGEDVRATARLPCFALLPEIPRRVLRRVRIEDYGARRPLAPFAEQIRAFRAGLWFSNQKPRVVAITSARPGEGKTIAAISLARIAALSGERVLLIECDTRQPSFTQRLHPEHPAGLCDVLAGDASLADVVQHDPVSGMQYIHAGRPRGAKGLKARTGGVEAKTSIAGPFLSEAMARLLAEVRQEFDLVLLDAPPVQAMTEARMAAGIADATVLCVRWRSTPRATVRYALELLEDAHANVVGTVLTRVDPRAHVRSGYADAEVYHRRYRQYQRG